MKISYQSAAVVAILGLVAACGGGGGSSPSALDEGQRMGVRRIGIDGVLDINQTTKITDSQGVAAGL